MSTPMGTVSVDNEEHVSVLTVDNSVHCPECEQTFIWPADTSVWHRDLCLLRNSKEPSVYVSMYQGRP